MSNNYSWPKYIYWPDLVSDNDSDALEVFFEEDHSGVQTLVEKCDCYLVYHTHENCNYNPETIIEVPSLDALKKFSEALFPGRTFSIFDGGRDSETNEESHQISFNVTDDRINWMNTIPLWDEGVRADGTHDLT